jgi:hypothetical protein
VYEKEDVAFKAQNEAGNDINVNFKRFDPPLGKTLGAGLPILQAGNRVVLDLDKGSYIYNRATKQYTEIYAKQGTLKYKLWINESQEKTNKGLTPMEIGALKPLLGPVLDALKGTNKDPQVPLSEKLASMTLSAIHAGKGPGPTGPHFRRRVHWP